MHVSSFSIKELSILAKVYIFIRMDKCEICNEDSSSGGKLQKLYTKGYENLIEQCGNIHAASLLEKLERKWTSNIPMVVHQRCRALFMQKEPDVEIQKVEPRTKRQKLSHGKYLESI